MVKGWLRKSGPVTAEAVRREIGFSIGPYGGVPWVVPTSEDRDKVRKLFLFLEDRRVLYNPDELEVRAQVESSVDQIRQTCLKVLEDLGERDFANVPVRAIQQACRRFQDESQMVFKHFMPYPRMDELNAGFFNALGAMRATIGHQVALLAAYYDLEVSGQLAQILPSVEEADS